MTTVSREVVRKVPATVVTRRNTSLNVIDGQARPTRKVAAEATKFLALLILALLFAGGFAASLGYL